MRTRHGDAGAHIDTRLDIALVDLWGEVAPRIKRNNPVRIIPRGLGRDGHGGFGHGVVRSVVLLECAHANGQGAVNGVGATVSPNSIADFDGSGEATTYDWATGDGICGTPMERSGLDTGLVRICWGHTGGKNDTL
jgi:hypothetical protein